MTGPVAAAVVLGGLAVVFAQSNAAQTDNPAKAGSARELAGSAREPAGSAGSPLTRHYQEGERLSYVMSGHNNGEAFEVRLNAVVKRDAAGQFVEEFSWSDLSWGGTPQALTAASREFRQTVTLAGQAPFVFPNLSRVQPGLIGPITDLLTFYADLFLSIHVAKVSKEGDRFHFPHPNPSSWADGKFVVIGENSIDFGITLTSLDRATAAILIKHVPPKEPSIQIPAPWMRAPVAGTANNWVEVKSANGGYVAAIGKETFDVQLTTDVETGAIIFAVLDNVVDAVERDCADRALMECGEPRPARHVRRIEMRLVTPA